MLDAAHNALNFIMLLQETIPVNLDETREKLLQALKNEATFLLDNSDEFSHEKMNLNTISAEKLRSTLEQFLRKQIDEVQLRTDTNIDGDSSDSRIDDSISNSSAVVTTTSSSNRSAPSPPDG
ncbi:unnamed protein product [Anisakis simplex]|uniref:GED domain-containing protein n=1 Tax=Anisakis simplex TaxID=6269 RepID=A0A0M3KG58_ANISI|nr:unnamed protein product [Anisakis simplex]